MEDDRQFWFFHAKVKRLTIHPPEKLRGNSIGKSPIPGEEATPLLQFRRIIGKRGRIPRRGSLFGRATNPRCSVYRHHEVSTLRSCRACVRLPDSILIIPKMIMKTNDTTLHRQRNDALMNDILFSTYVHHFTVCQLSPRTACLGELLR